jgi:hypothetical protein
MGRTMARSSSVAGRRPMSATMRAPQAKTVGVRRGAHDKGGGPRVPGVDDPTQRQIVEEERVRLIHDERGGELLDGAVEGGDRDVGRRERPLGALPKILRYALTQNFGPARYRSYDDVARPRVGLHDPEGETPRRPGADEAPVGTGERIEQGPASTASGQGRGRRRAARTGPRTARVAESGGQGGVDDPRGARTPSAPAARWPGEPTRGPAAPRRRTRHKVRSP